MGMIAVMLFEMKKHDKNVLKIEQSGCDSFQTWMEIQHQSFHISVIKLWTVNCEPAGCFRYCTRMSYPYGKLTKVRPTQTAHGVGTYRLFKDV